MTATNGVDYAVTGTLSWAGGDVAAKTLTVTPSNDLVYEGNETFTIGQGNRKVEISQGNDTLDITQGNAKITLNSGKYDVKAGTHIELKVGSNSVKIDNMGVTIKGTMIKIQGTAMVKVKAPMTDVKGDALVKVKGGIVMIN